MILGPEPWTQPDDLTSFVRAYVLGHDQLMAEAITYPFEPKSIAYLPLGSFGPFRSRMAGSAAGVLCTSRSRHGGFGWKMAGRILMVSGVLVWWLAVS
jgi:hypothetical protein